jgi:EmrB/QacA subfamily drug resistance transporter
MTTARGATPPEASATVLVDAGRTSTDWWTVSIIVLATSLTGIGLSIMTVAFPAIAKAFPDASPAKLSWIANLFTIVGAATLVPCGVLADRFGRKRMVLVGVALFTLGSLVGALAWSPAILMLARTLQALGSSAYTPASAALVISAFPAERMGTAFGVWAVSGGVSSSLGPALGGAVIDAGGWPWAFWINLPAGLLILAVGPFVLPDVRAGVRRALPDPIGALAVMVGVSAVVLGVVQSRQWGWIDQRTFGSMLAGLAVLTWFVLRCRHHPNPLLELDLFRIPTMWRANLGTFLVAVTWFGANWAVVQLTFREWGWTPLKAGVVTSPIALFSGVVGILAGRHAYRIGHRRLIIPGTVVMAASFVWLWSGVSHEQSVLLIVLVSAVLGSATGLVYPSFIAASMTDIPVHRHAIGTGINFMTQRIGTTVGVAVAITLVAAAPAGDVIDGFHRALVVAIVGTVACFVMGCTLDTKRAHLAPPR